MRHFFDCAVLCFVTFTRIDQNRVGGSGSTCLNAVILPRYEKPERFPGVLFNDTNALPL